MNMRAIIRYASVLSLATISLASCKKDKNNPAPGNTDLKVDYSILSPASDYINTFKDDAGNTTVDFSGQTARQDMLSKIDSVLKEPAKSNANISASLLKNMFANTANPFAQSDLNTSGKNIKSKTAQSFTTVNQSVEWERIEGWFDKVATMSVGLPRTADNGTSGVAVNGSSKYLVDEKGIEYGQLIQKGLIGACFFDQISNIYLGDTKQNESGNTELAEGKNYTILEHYWDEAYGYLTKSATYPSPVKSNERFLGSYARQYKDSVNIFLAFLKGRAGATNNDRTMMNNQRAQVQSMLEQAIAALTISYFNKTKSSAATPAAAMHSLSEGLGFLYALRYAKNPKILAAKSDELMNKLMTGNGYYDLTAAAIDEVRDYVATTFGLDKETVVNH